MKAGVLFQNKEIRCVDVPTPEPGPGELLVRVKASGICGSDVPRVHNNGAHYYPIILGHEFSGVVEKLGAGVENFQAGDRVAGIPLVPCMQCADCLKGDYSLCKHYSFIGSRIPGSFAEYVVLPSQNAVKFDPSVSFEQGAFFEPATVALHGIKCAGYKGGGEVAILGGGTIGLFTMQWAKIYGAKRVTVFDISDARLALAKKLGADAVVNTKENGFGREYFDYVFETAGQVTTLKAAFQIAANKASVCCIGTPHEDLTFTPKEWENMNRKEFRLTGSWMSYSAPFPGEGWLLTAHFFKTGQLKFDEQLIFKKFPLSEIDAAFALFATPGAVGGKVLITNE